MRAQLQEEVRFCHHCPHGWLNPLGELGEEDQRKLARHRYIVTFPAQSVIVRRGEPVTQLYCISSGTAKAVLPVEDNTDVLITLHKPGDVLGLRDLFGERRHSVSVVALEELRACVLPAELIERSARENAHFWSRVAQLLAREIEAIEEQFLLLHHRSVRERVVHLLLLLLRTYGADDEGYLRFPASSSSLAELLHTSPSAVRRTLSALERRHLVRCTATRIQIPSPDALCELLRH